MPDPNRFERCVEHQVRNCLVCHPITRLKAPDPTSLSQTTAGLANSVLPDLPNFPSSSETEACPKCGGTETKPEGDHPAGNWWSVCSGCGLEVSKWDTYQKFAVVPRQAQAVIPPQLDSPLVGAAMRYTRACSDHAQAQKDVARMREQLDSAVKYEENMRQARIAAHEEMTKLVTEAA